MIDLCEIRQAALAMAMDYHRVIDDADDGSSVAMVMAEVDEVLDTAAKFEKFLLGNREPKKEIPSDVKASIGVIVQ